MGQQNLSIETANNNFKAGQQITVDIFHEVEREATESGAIKLSLSLFFNDNELQLDSIDYPSFSFNRLFEATLGDNNNDDGSDETNKRTAISFQQASLFAPYPDEKTKIATATFTVLETFDGSEVSVKIPSATSQTYNNAPPEVFEPKILALEVANTAPALTGTPAILTNGTEDVDYILNASDLLQGFTDADGDDLSVTDLQATNGSLTDNNNETWTFIPNSNFNGTVDLTYNVSDNKGNVTPATSSFLVNSVDDAPEISNPLADVTVEEDADNTVIDLSNVFTDLDNNDSEIVKTVANHSNQSLVTATVDGNNLILDYLDNQSGTAEITIQGTSNGQSVSETLTVTVNPVGDNNISGTAAKDRIKSGAGNDIVRGGDGNDTLDGDRDKDRLFGDSGADELDGGEDRDFLQGGSEGDRLFGSDGDDTLYGDSGDDTLYGGAGDDILFAGAGQDLLDGGTGNDSLLGFDGNDTFVLRSGDSNDIIYDYQDTFDSLSLADGLTFGSLTIVNNSSNTATEISDSNGLLVTLIGINAEDLTIDDFV